MPTIGGHDEGAASAGRLGRAVGRGTTFGDGSEGVTEAKTRRLRQLATQWLATSGIRARCVRFDVVSVMVGGSAPVISHIRDAF